MNLSKKGATHNQSEGVTVTTGKVFLLDSNENNNIAKYTDQCNVSKPNLIKRQFGNLQFCNIYGKKKEDNITTHSTNIHVLCRCERRQNFRQLSRSSSVRIKQKEGIRQEAILKSFSNSECFDDVSLKLLTINNWKSLSDPNIFAHTNANKENLADASRNYAFESIMEDSLICKTHPNVYPNMDLILATNIDVQCQTRQTSESQDIVEEEVSQKVQEDLEALNLIDNSKDNKVEEMTYIPSQPTLVDKPSTSPMTPSSLSTSGNCIMCRLGYEHEEHTLTNEHYGMRIDNFNKTNRIDANTLTDMTASSKGDKKEANAKYFLVSKETSGTSGDIDDEGCFLSNLTPTNTSSKGYFKNCKRDIASSNIFTSVLINDRECRTTNEKVIDGRGCDNHDASTSIRTSNNVNGTSRSSFSERCSSSDVDSGRVSDTDTGTTSSTNSSNHTGEKQKYDKCHTETSEHSMETSSNCLHTHLIPTEVEAEENKTICSQEVSHGNTMRETDIPFAANYKPSQMVHIVPHSFCDFLGTLPASESRCNRTKTSHEPEVSHELISDKFMSEKQNGNTVNDFFINNSQSDINSELSREEIVSASTSDKSLLSQNCRHNQNKVTVFVPYSTIVRCMNETMDRKRKGKNLFQNEEENEQTRSNLIAMKKETVTTKQHKKANQFRYEDNQMPDSLIESCNIQNPGIILINDNTTDIREEKIPVSGLDSVSKDKSKSLLPAYSNGKASCVGIVMGGEESVKQHSDKMNGVKSSHVVNQNDVANILPDVNNKLYSKRMTKRLQQYNTYSEHTLHTDEKGPCSQENKELNGVNPCMLMLTEDSEELILPSPPPFPTSTTATPVPNYDEIIRNELLQDSEDFLNQIRRGQSMPGIDKEGNEIRKNVVMGIPRRKDLCKLLGLNERNVGDLLIVPDEKVKLAQKVALMHKCNISPITPMPDTSIRSMQQDHFEKSSPCKRVSQKANCKEHGGHNFSNDNNDDIDSDEMAAIKRVSNGPDANVRSNGKTDIIEDIAKVTTCEINSDTSLIMPQRKNSKNLAKFFGVDDEIESKGLPSIQESNGNVAKEKGVFSEASHISKLLGSNNIPQDNDLYGNGPNIVMRRKKKKGGSSSELRSNVIDKLGIFEPGHQLGSANSSHELSENSSGRPKSLLVSWNNLLKRSSVRWRNGNNIVRRSGLRRGGVLNSVQKFNENYSSGDDSEEYSSSDDEILQELQVPVQFRQMGGPSGGYSLENGKTNGKEFNEENNWVGGPKRKDLSKFLGLDDSDSEEIVFIQNNKLPRQKPPSNNDTFSSFESFSKQSHHSSDCNYTSNTATGISSHSSHVEVGSNSAQITEPSSISCNENGNSSSPTNTASTSTTYHPTCHLPLRNPILDMLENDMDKFDPPPRKSVVFKDYGLFSVEESIAQGLPIIPFDSVNMDADGKITEKKKGQSGVVQKKRKKDAERRSSEIFITAKRAPQKLQNNGRARSSSSEMSRDNVANNVNGCCSHIQPQIKIEPKRNEIRNVSETNQVIDRTTDTGVDHFEHSTDVNAIRANQLPVRSALRSPNSPPKRPCGPVVFGANSRRTISPIRKTNNKPGVTLAYIPPLAHPMMPAAVYSYQNHRFPVILYGHHHPNVGYISHLESSGGNFCRAFTRQLPSKSGSVVTHEKTAANVNGGTKYTCGPRTASKKAMMESRFTTSTNGLPVHRVNNNVQRSYPGNRSSSGNCNLPKPPRQRQIVNTDNEYTAPPLEPYTSPDSNGTYVIMKNSASKKSLSLLTSPPIDKHSLSNFL